MFCFGLGTLPAMLALSLAADRTMRWLQRVETRRVAGLLLIAYGLWTLSTPIVHHLPGETQSHSGQHHAH